MKTVTEFPHSIREDADVGILMPDGCRLSARIWRPIDADTTPVPAILEYLPYRKRDGTAGRDARTHPYFAGHGYAAVRVDMRGNGDSDGLMDDEYTAQEMHDALDVIAWLTEQPWCDGNVGMMGISWGGFNGLQIAALAPPALKAVVSLCATVDRFADDIHWKGGCLLGVNFAWAATMLAYSSRPPDPAIVGDRWRELWLSRLRAQPHLIERWLSHNTRDDYWRHGSICEDYPMLRAPVLAIGGWHDGYRNTPSHLVANLNAPVKAIVGPWNHKYPHIAAPTPAIGFCQEALRWWDRWLKGVDTGVENDPAYRTWLMDPIAPDRRVSHRPGRWITEENWPPEAKAAQIFQLSEASLVRQTDGSETVTFARSICSPADCGLTAGDYFPFAYGPEMPAEQSTDDAHSATFDAAPATEITDILGAPSVSLTLTCDKPHGQICVRLCDVAPEGTSAFITHGVMNLELRDNPASATPVVPGEPMDITLTLDQIAYRLLPGHRLRLAVSSVYWPYLWPSPELATLTLQTGQLALPVRVKTASSDEWQFEGPEGTPASDVTVRRATSMEKTVSCDAETGAVTMTVETDFGEVEDNDHGLVSGSRSTQTWTTHPNDPLCASVEISWETTTGRNDWMTRVETKSKMWSTANAFHTSAQVTAFEGDTIAFEKSYAHEVDRGPH